MSCALEIRLDLTHITIVGLIKVRIFFFAVGKLAHKIYLACLTILISLDLFDFYDWNQDSQSQVAREIIS